MKREVVDPGWGRLVPQAREGGQRGSECGILYWKPAVAETVRANRMGSGHSVP